MQARALLRRLRCFWRWPVGHAYEVIDFVDPVSGRWAAWARCIACGRETGLAVGNRRTGAHYAGNPLASMLAANGTLRSVPASKASGAAPDRAASSVLLTAPDGAEIAVRYVRVRFDLGLRRRVYCAWRVGGDDPPAIAEDFGSAVARAAGLEPADPWVERLARELAGELVPIA